MKLVVPASAEAWLFRIFRDIEVALGGPQDVPLRLKSYTVAGLPGAAAWKGGMIIVSNEVGGEIPAWSDGTNWRRVSDRAIVS